jgi:hypothetical protein
MTARCIDIETTGIDPATDGVVEMASVDLLREGGMHWVKIRRRLDGRPSSVPLPKTDVDRPGPPR